MAQERTEAATPRRRERAREEGRVAVSRDLTAGAALLAFCAVGRMCWGTALATASQAAKWTMELAGRDPLGSAAAAEILRVWEIAALPALASALAAGIATGLLVGFAQTRLLFSLQPLQPTLEKLSPVNGLRRMFSVHGFVEAAKGALKVGLILGTATWMVWARHDELGSLGNRDALGVAAAALDICFAVAVRVAMLLVLLGVGDYAYQRWELERSLRMSRQELIEEYRQYEGDPHIRARRRAMQRTLLQQGISREMSAATVVVTNPTYIAVALLYNPGMWAPRVVAKGRHRVAQRIVAIARRAGVPLVENVAVARSLYRLTVVGGYVPGPLYQAVAEVLALVYRRAQERRARQATYFRR